MNAGPTLTNAFHVIGAMFDHVYPDGNPTNVNNGIQTWNVPPGGGAMFELTIPDAGKYPFVTHSFAYTGLGAVGVILVTDKAPAAPAVYPDFADPFDGGLTKHTGRAPAFNAAPAPAGPATIAAANVAFDVKKLEIMAGDKINFVNKDALPHDLTIDALKIKVALAGTESKTFAVSGPPGTYTYYCSVPGHRAAGMEGTLVLQPAGAH